MHPHDSISWMEQAELNACNKYSNNLPPLLQRDSNHWNIPKIGESMPDREPAKAGIPTAGGILNIPKTGEIIRELEE
jgi:hypothetical protein